MLTPNTTSTQFSLQSLLILTTIFAVLFAFVSALGVSPQHALLGFAVCGGVAGSVAMVVEVAYRIVGLR